MKHYTEFEVGDFVKFRKRRGRIIEIVHQSNCPYTGAPVPGSIIIEDWSGKEFMEYDHVFQYDIEMMRECKLKELGIV